MDQRYFMAIINNLQLGEETVNAREIVGSMFQNKRWRFSPSTSKVRSLRENDELVVYVAGKGNRCFLGQFTLATAPQALQTVPSKLDRFAKLYPLSSEMKDAVLWAEPKPIVDMLHKLSFVKDKQNYGLHLRHGLRELSAEDYEVIVG